MQVVKVNLRERSYNIIIDENAISKLHLLIKKLRLGNTAVVITNRFLKHKFGKLLENEFNKAGIGFKFFEVPDSEKTKSYNELIKIINIIAKYGQDKKIFLVAFGGGVIGDLTGFCASIYKRGVNYIQIPTTLLAQIDSSIGGKTAIDLSFAKNLVGAFYQPKLVLSDLLFLKSLPQKEIKAGLSEIVKCAIIKDRLLFNSLEKNSALALTGRLDYLKYVIYKTSSIKAKIVSIDEKETKDERIKLNFGHTIGHAIEATYNFRITHGQAVALGMIYEARIANLLGVISNINFQKIKALILKLGLCPKLKKINADKVISSQKFDKKFIGKINRFVLPKKIGRAGIYSNIDQALIRKALRETI